MCHRAALILGLVIPTIAAPRASAWDGFGHELIAYVAYQDLTPQVKARADAILRKHPQYELLAKECPSSFDKELYVFMRAAIWPDLVRDEKVDPGRVEHHGPWHYINFPIGALANNGATPHGDWAAGTSPENILQALEMCDRDLHAAKLPEVDLARRLSWIEHLIGDIHQPLHSVSAFSTEYDRGDAGGNLIAVSEKGKIQKLHAYWDSVAGTTSDEKRIVERGDAMRKSKIFSRAAFKEELQRGGFAEWAKESVEIARQVVYQEGKLRGAKVADKDHLPAKAPELPSDYRKKAETVAEKQIALAAYRLANALNRVLSSNKE